MLRHLLLASVTESIYGRSSLESGTLQMIQTPDHQRMSPRYHSPPVKDAIVYLQLGEALARPVFGACMIRKASDFNHNNPVQSHVLLSSRSQVVDHLKDSDA